MTIKKYIGFLATLYVTYPLILLLLTPFLTTQFEPRRLMTAYTSASSWLSF